MGTAVQGQRGWGSKGPRRGGGHCRSGRGSHVSSMLWGAELPCLHCELRGGRCRWQRQLLPACHACLLATWRRIRRRIRSSRGCGGGQQSAGGGSRRLQQQQQQRRYGRRAAAPVRAAGGWAGRQQASGLARHSSSRRVYWQQAHQEGRSVCSSRSTSRQPSTPAC